MAEPTSIGAPSIAARSIDWTSADAREHIKLLVKLEQRWAQCGVDSPSRVDALTNRQRIEHGLQPSVPKSKVVSYGG